MLSVMRRVLGVELPAAVVQDAVVPGEQRALADEVVEVGGPGAYEAEASAEVNLGGPQVLAVYQVGNVPGIVGSFPVVVAGLADARRRTRGAWFWLAGSDINGTSPSWASESFLFIQSASGSVVRGAVAAGRSRIDDVASDLALVATDAGSAVWIEDDEFVSCRPNVKLSH